jgi:GntR family transcriptional regulator, vanillate catabolism transcriptional regulator
MERYSSLNLTFHALLAQMSQSDVVQRQIERITALPFASPSAFLDDQSHTGTLIRTLSIAQDQHRALIEAIAGREGFRAESLAREHARAARRNVELFLAKGADPQDTIPSLALMAV